VDQGESLGRSRTGQGQQKGYHQTEWNQISFDFHFAGMVDGEIGA
jgi:hypothetical protein